MNRIFVLSLTLLGVFSTSQAFAMSHGGAPVTGPWSLIARIGIEIECMFETTLFVLQLLLSGQWFVLANLDGICTTAVNSLFFTNAWSAVATALVLTALMLTLTILALHWLLRRITTASLNAA